MLLINPGAPKDTAKRLFKAKLLILPYFAITFVSSVPLNEKNDFVISQ
jgi:hypothetical protein